MQQDTDAFLADITREIIFVSPRPLKYGGTSDIYIGTWRSFYGDVKVALKVLRTLDPTDKGIMRKLQHEITVWKRLSHPNIHMMCGLCNEVGPLPALVSPWYDKGDINQYLKTRGTEVRVDGLRLQLMCQVVSGLKYLHDNKIVHGDIKGANVLISDDGVARLSDFGFSSILAENSESFSQHTTMKGTIRWMAPELFLDDNPRPSFASDIWALGCLLIEIQCDVPPYHLPKRNIQQIIIAISQSELPRRPDNMPNLIWSLVLECCKISRLQRPSARDVQHHLQCLPVVARLARIIVSSGATDPVVAGDLVAAAGRCIGRLVAHGRVTIQTVSAFSDHELVVCILPILLVRESPVACPLKPQTAILLDACARMVRQVSQVSQHLSLPPVSATFASPSPPDVQFPHSHILPLARMLALVDVELANYFILSFSEGV